MFFSFTLSAQIKVDSVVVVEGANVPSSILTGDEILNYLAGSVGNRKWNKIEVENFKKYVRPFADSLYSIGDTLFLRNIDGIIFKKVLASTNVATEWSVESFVNHSGSTVTVGGTLPNTNQTSRIRVMRPGAELTQAEDYTISGNTITFINPLDGENIKIWYR